MLTCTNCGANNPLGRVFCGSCGRKLPDADLAREDMTHGARSATRRKRILTVSHAVLGSFFGILAVLALWPQPADTRVSSMDSALRCRRKLELLSQAARERKFIELDFTEEEVHSYVVHGILGKVKARQGSVRLREKFVQLQWRVKLFGPHSLSPALSFNVTLLPSVQSGRFYITSARFGHLPLRWPFGGIVRRMFLEMCRSRLEWPLVKRLRVDRCSDGVMIVRTSEGYENDDAISTIPKELDTGLGDDPAPVEAP